MVFEWVTEKFKQRQLQKALIKECGEDMVIISGLSILNPTYRTMFKDMPFYDKETDMVDFKKLEQYICDLTHWKNNYGEKQCKDCFYIKYADSFKDATLACKLELIQLEHPTGLPYELPYLESVELEHLRELFMELTGESEYHKYLGREKRNC